MLHSKRLTRGKIMKEKLIKYLKESYEFNLLDDQEIAIRLIEEFFDNDQPERLSPEDISFNPKSPIHDWGKTWNVSDSPNSANK